METLLIVGLSAGLLFFLIRANPAAAEQPVRSSDKASPEAQADITPTWRESLPRQALIFALSAAIAYLVMRAIFSIWFGFAGKIGAVIGISANWVTLFLLIGIAFYIHRINAAPKIRSFLAAKWAYLIRRDEMSSSVPLKNETPVTVCEEVNEPSSPLPPMAPAFEKKNPRRFSLWLIAGIAVIALALIFDPRSEDQQPAAEQPQQEYRQDASTVKAQTPQAGSNVTYLYRVMNDTEMETPDGPVMIKGGSCLRSVTGPNGEGVFIENGKINVRVEVPNAADGMYGAGVVSGIQVGFVRQDLLNNYGILAPNSPACTGELVQAVSADVPETSGPSQPWRVVNSANLYQTSDVTTKPLQILAGSSCVFSTGKIRGDMMEVRATGGGQTQTLWARKADFTEAPSFVTEATCQFKL